LRTYAFNGRVVVSPPGGAIDLPYAYLNQRVRGRYVIETSTVDIEPAPDDGEYINAGTRGFVRFGRVASGFDRLGIEITDLRILDDFPICCPAWSHTDMYVGFFQYDKLNGAAITPGTAGAELRLEEGSNTLPIGVLVSDAIPLPPPPLASFTTARNFSLYYNANQWEVGITRFGRLGSLGLPLLPSSVSIAGNGSIIWHFSTTGDDICVTSGGCWIDPPLASGFTYETDGESLFTGIGDFPTGFASDFEVWVEGSSLGTFGPGDSVDFSGYPGGGVTRFEVTGISGPVDTDDEEAFPLMISFDIVEANFTMTSINSVELPSLSPWGIGALMTALLASASLRLHSKRSEGV